MAGPFEAANVAVVEAAYENLEVTQTANAVASAQAAPSAASDGINLRSASRGFVVARPSAGETCDVRVWVYFSQIDEWINLTEAARTGVDELGDSWKINCGGADRLYVQVATLSGGTADAWFFRSYV